MKNIKDDKLELVMVIEEIKLFLEPVFEVITNAEEWQKKWNSGLGTWENLRGGIESDKSS